jgi:hypothetical protein
MVASHSNHSKSITHLLGSSHHDLSETILGKKMNPTEQNTMFKTINPWFHALEKSEMALCPAFQTWADSQELED